MGTSRKTQRPRREENPSESFAAKGNESTAAETINSARAGDRAERLRTFLFQMATIVLASLWIYSPTYHGDWLWDDDQSITANPVAQAPWSFHDLWVVPPGADYFPLAATGFWLEWHAFGMNSTGYHVVNIVLHILGALAFWRLLHVMKLPGAWLGGLLFAIHPICVETVGWVSELKNTLSQPLFLLSAIAFVKFDDAVTRKRESSGVEAAGPSHAARHYAWAVLFFLLAMFAKTSIVMYPVMILLYSWWKHGLRLDTRGITALVWLGGSLSLTLVPEMIWMKALRDGQSSWSLFYGCQAVAVLGPLTSLALAAGLLGPSGQGDEKAAALAGGSTLERYVLFTLPFFWISLVLGLATCYFQWTRAIGQEKILVGGVASRITTAGMATLFYLWKSVWPFDLLPIYPRWEVDPPKVWQFLPWPIMIAAGWWLWNNRGTVEKPTWQRNVNFSLGFFLLALFPILGFITISYMRITWVADHFLYLPIISVIGLGSAAVAAAYAKAKASEQPVALAAGAVLLAVLGFSSFRYAHAWANEDALWTHTLKTNHEAWQAHNRLGAKKFARGDVDGAHYHFQNSTRLRPDLGETHNNLGTTLSARAQMLGQRGDQAGAKREMNAAIEQFTEACRVTPHVPAIRVNLANALAAAGRFGEAADKYKELLQQEPGNPALINNYGVALYKQGKKEESIVQFKKALEIAPNLKDARESLAVALGEKPDPSANQPATPPPPGGQFEFGPLPTSPTLGPASSK